MRGDPDPGSELGRLLSLPADQLGALPADGWAALSAEDQDRLARHLLDEMPQDAGDNVMVTARLRAGLLEEFGRAVEAYSRMVTSDDYGEASEWSERLAERWRETAEVARLEQLGDELLPSEALQLFGALASSMILAGDDDERSHRLALGEQEFAERLVLAGSEGIWADWEELMRVVELERAQRFGSVSEIKPGAPKRPPAHLPTPGRRRRTARANELLAELERRLLETRDFYYESLAPDGRALTAEERAATERHLQALAVCCREIDLDRYIWPTGEWDAMQPLLAELRSMQYSLALAVSNDPRRRAKAASSDERKARAFVAAELVRGASREEAVGRLRAEIQEARR